jgi:UPF0755 protein
LRTLLLFILLVALPCLWAAHEMTRAGPLTQSKTVVIAKGTSGREIASLLEQQGIIREALLFRALSKIYAEDKLKAGEYEFTAGQTLRTVVEKIRDGKTVERFITFAEGLTSFEIVERLRAEPTLSGEITDIPPEGSLLPETYHYTLNDARANIITRMQALQKTTMAELWPTRDSNLPFTTEAEAITLASIVEKETGVADERPRVAGVFINRLRLGMKLQSDPTSIYAITLGKTPLGRDLFYKDLETPSRYNTYYAAGLPPGPIANPGRASLAAVLKPETHNFIYFVADGTGGHAFAVTLPEHNANVAKWRMIQKKN